MRVFPSLVNCCTIDWFTAWPDDALLRVAENYIVAMNLSKDEIILEDVGLTRSLSIEKEEEIPKKKITDLEYKLVEMVMAFNTNVIDSSEQ